MKDLKNALRAFDEATDVVQAYTAVGAMRSLITPKILRELLAAYDQKTEVPSQVSSPVADETTGGLHLDASCVGKTYLRRDGSMATVGAWDGGSTYPVITQDPPLAYTSGGRYFSNQDDHPLDLISEAPSPIDDSEGGHHD